MSHLVNGKVEGLGLEVQPLCHVRLLKAKRASVVHLCSFAPVSQHLRAEVHHCDAAVAAVMAHKWSEHPVVTVHRSNVTPTLTHTKKQGCCTTDCCCMLDMQQSGELLLCVMFVHSGTYLLHASYVRMPSVMQSCTDVLSHMSCHWWRCKPDSTIYPHLSYSCSWRSDVPGPSSNSESLYVRCFCISGRTES